MYDFHPVYLKAHVDSMCYLGVRAFYSQLLYFEWNEVSYKLVILRKQQFSYMKIRCKHIW